MHVQYFPDMSSRRNLLNPRRFLVLLAVFLGAAWGAAPQATAPQNQGEKSPNTRALGRRLQGKSVPNFGEVTPTLYRGGLLNATGLKALAKMGISVVVDTHANDEG